MPPEITVAELLVDFGAVVVVVGLDVVGVVAVVAAFDELDVELVEAPDVVVESAFEADAVFAEVVFDAIAVVPGISEATRPPRTAALKTAPPAAIAVTRRTLRSAFDLSAAFTFFDMTSSSGCGQCCRRIHHTARL